MFDLIYYWIDVIWLPVLFFGVDPKHRWWAVGFVLASMLLMRLQAEFMTYGGYDHGIMNVMSSHVYTRGIVVCSIFYSLFLLMAHFSRNTHGIVFMAASLTFFFMIFFVGSLVMLL